MITTETVRRASGDTPVARTRAERKSVKKVKEMTNPATIPHGLLFPPVTEPESTIGKMGRMQGDRIVTTPAKNAKKNNSNIPCIERFPFR
jgi:hypothetical protein